MNNKSGSVTGFESNWRTRREANYNHWTAGAPRNQIQFAFRQHWQVFSSLMGDRAPGEALEVGCGRGSLSSYFSANGWNSTLLDYSWSVLDIAKEIFKNNGHVGKFVCGDVNALPFTDERFDVVASIGLLEHFEEPATALREQWRVLKPNGWLFAYIVPERPHNLQRHFNWINRLLKIVIESPRERSGKSVPKEPIYRNDYASEFYLERMDSFAMDRLLVSGIYSMPMISHSPEFPFSLLPPLLEKMLVAAFQVATAVRSRVTGTHGWLIEEKLGQAFLIAARKRAGE